MILGREHQTLRLTCDIESVSREVFRPQFAIQWQTDWAHEIIELQFPCQSQ